MIQMDASRIEAILSQFQNKKIIVVGDLMLDHYLWGKVSRISPEAPVPVVDVDNESFRLGGAANVSYNINTLGATAIPIGVIGDDNSGKRIRDIFKENGFNTKGIIIDHERESTIKTRIIAEDQHVVRTDRECRNHISDKIQKQIIQYFEKQILEADGVIFEDYNKGLLSSIFIEQLIAIANKHQKMIFVDPKYENFFDFKNVTLFKPNRKEVADRLGINLSIDKNLDVAGQQLLDRLHCKYLLITLGANGMALFEKNQPRRQMPTRAVKVHDVSGAGDTVISTIAVSMTAGAKIEEAAVLANHAAGIVVGEVGIVPIAFDALNQEMLSAAKK